MHATSHSVKRLSWMLTIIIFSGLSLSSLGGLFETPWLAYFWYAALAGMAGMILLSMLLGIGWMWRRLARRCHQMWHHWSAGVPGH